MHILFYQFWLSSVIKAKTGSHGETFFVCFFKRVLASAISRDSLCLSGVCSCACNPAFFQAFLQALGED